jgi:hypothetical protein
VGFSNPTAANSPTAGDLRVNILDEAGVFFDDNFQILIFND